VFRGFANVWSPVIEASRLKDKPLPVVLAGESIVLFRGDGGRIGALVDRCPHRGVALSLGRVCDDGHLECPFHGWRFDVSGANRHVPLNPDAKRDQLGATALPVRQIGDLIWVFTAPGIEAPFEPVAPEGLTAPGLMRTYIERQWDCHWTRAMENMLDSPHLPFVHKRTIGRPLLRRMTPQSSMDITWQDTANGGRASASLDGADNGAYLEFFQPNMMALNIPIPGKHLRIHALVIPAEEGRTRLMVAGSRDFATAAILNPWFSWMNGKIADEDRAVVESSGRSETPEPGSERSVATDRATLRFRKYYYDTLRESEAGAPTGPG